MAPYIDYAPWFTTQRNRQIRNGRICRAISMIAGLILLGSLVAIAEDPAIEYLPGIIGLTAVVILLIAEFFVKKNWSAAGYEPGSLHF